MAAVFLRGSFNLEQAGAISAAAFFVLQKVLTAKGLNLVIAMQLK
ncbi:hypothetical protein [Paenibacillus ihumii]|nr:hypothetical protein [Paenibacillus ihumii]